MSTGPATTTNRISRALGALFGGQALQALLGGVNVGTVTAIAPAAAIDAPFTFRPRSGGPVILLATFNATCSAASIEATISLIKGAATVGTISSDSGGSADRNVTGTLLGLDAAGNPPVTPVIYHVHGVVIAQTLSVVTNRNQISLWALELPAAFIGNVTFG